MQRNRGEGAPDDPKRTFYRIVRTDPPTVADFTSYAARGRPAPDELPETSRLWSGVSVYERESQARRKARGMPWRGQGYIAELRLAPDGGIRAERKGAERWSRHPVG